MLASLNQGGCVIGKNGRYLLIILAAGLLLCIKSPLYASEYDNFLKELRSVPSILRVDREAMTLWIKVDPSSLGTPVKEKAEEVADGIAKTYKYRMGKGICVRIYHGDRRTLAKSCSY